MISLERTSTYLEVLKPFTRTLLKSPEKRRQNMGREYGSLTLTGISDALKWVPDFGLVREASG